MTGLNDVSGGFGLAMSLMPYADSKCELVVKFNVKDHAETWAEDEVLQGLDELDTWKTDSFTKWSLYELGEHMKTLGEHKVFTSGRSFWFEGFEVEEDYDDNFEGTLNGVMVSCKWGS
jgi:hypothetical protein